MRSCTAIGSGLLLACVAGCGGGSEAPGGAGGSGHSGSQGGGGGSAIGPQSIHVDDDAPAGGDGRSWNTALRFLQDALRLARGGDTVLVAQGRYTPDRDEATPGGTGARNATFQLRSGVTLLGGYAGLGAESPYENKPLAYATVLSGDLAGDDGPDFANDDENSLHVVTGSGADATAVLDGFRIMGGNADGPAAWPGSDQIGGGMITFEGGAPSVRRCEIANNRALAAGGGMANAFGSSPMITNSTFVGNVADLGGAMANAEESSPIVTDVGFQDNTASSGGAMYNALNSAPIVTRTTFHGNRAINGNGGGMYSEQGAAPRLAESSFVENTAGHVGGALSFRETPEPVLVTSCAFLRNTSEDGGGAIRVGHDAALVVVNGTFRDNSTSYAGRAGGLDVGSDQPVALRTTTVDNSIFWGNTTLGQPAQLALAGSYPAGLTVRFSDVEGGAAAVAIESAEFPFTWGEGNIDADPMFAAAPPFAATSPCIDAGSNDLLQPGMDNDLAGAPRVLPGEATAPARVDMGAYEYLGGAACAAAGSVACSVSSDCTLIDAGEMSVCCPPHGSSWSVWQCPCGVLAWLCDDSECSCTVSAAIDDPAAMKLPFDCCGQP